MAINPNNGVLDIINGTLKVSSIDIKQAGGFTTAINTVARNDVLLFDDQKSTTTFTPTAQGGYMSSTGVTRDTSSNYLELGTASDAGWVYWPLQLPNSWHTEFDMHVTATGGVLTYSLFNTSEPNHTDYTNNDGGYKIVFDNTNNQIVIYWEGSVHKTVSATLRSNDWQHVNINYFQGAISISLAGKAVLTHEFTENYQEFDSRYIGFSATAGTSHKIRHLRVHNSDKWLYTKTSNASDIAYVSGNVGIGSLSPTELLDVHGNVHIASDLTVDGNLTVTGTTTYVDTTNATIEDPIIELAKGNTVDTIDAGLIVSRGASNVAIAFRGDEEELAFGYTQSGASDADVTPIANGGLDVRVYGNLFADNLTTTANVEATYLKGDGSEITQITLDQVVGYANTTANTIQLTNSDVGLKATGNVEANYFVGDGSKLTGLVTDLQSVADNGNTSSNTIQFTNATTAFIANSNVGIGTATPSANLHVAGYQYVNDPPTLANSFDHTDAPLTLTHGTATSDTAINDPKPLLHLTRDGTTSQSYGARASFNLSRYENSSTHSRSRLDLALADGTYAESTVMTLRADGKVGVGTTSPTYKLNISTDTNYDGISLRDSTRELLKIAKGGNGSYINMFESGTSKVNISTNGNSYINGGNVGIGTATPQEKFHLYGSPIIQHGTRYDVGANDGWYKIGTWNAASATGARLKISLIGGESYSAQERARGGETFIYASINNNNPTTASNMSGSIHAHGKSVITQAKFKQVGTDRTQYEIIAYVEPYTQHTMKIECSETTTFTRAWTSASDPGADSATVQAALFTHVVDNSGNVGIGTTSPLSPLDIVAVKGITTAATVDDLVSNATIRISGYSENHDALCIGMLSTDTSGNSGNNPYAYIQNIWDTPKTARPLLLNPAGGNVGIGTTSPAYKLDVHGSANVGALTATTISGPVSGNASTATTATNQSGGTVSATTGNFSDVLSLEAGTAVSSGVNSANKTNTYINFKEAGTGSDWAYLRQIGGSNQMIMSFDFHDDTDDCKFLIRGVHSSGQDPDVITDRFSVVNDKVGCGTSSPDYPLDVEFSGDNGARVKSTNSHASLFVDADSGYGYLRFQDSGANTVWLQSKPNGDLVIRPQAGDERVAFRTDGTIDISPNTSTRNDPQNTGVYVYNQGTGDACLAARVKDSNAGDPYVSFDVAGEAGWSMGMDNNDSNKFKLAYAWSNLNTNTRFLMDSNGAATFTSICKASRHVTSNGTSGDGDDNAGFSLLNDYSSWVNIFRESWIGADNGWGTFWAGNNNASYARGSSNPNEYVLVGGGNKRFTFDLDSGGHAYFDGTLTQNNYDYAEYFEWDDGNPENEDRRGYSVVLTSDGKIRKATSDDDPMDIFGAASGTSCVVGDGAMYDWNGKYEIDEWGTRIVDNVCQLSWEVELENGETKGLSYDEDQVPEGVTVPENVSRRYHKRLRISPDYDENKVYVPRDQRKEWCTIGLLGKVRVRDESPKHPNWKYLKTIAGKKLWLIK